MKICVCLFRQHGDVLLSSALFSCLRRAYPTAEINAYIHAETLPMLEGHPAIDRFLLYDRQQRAWRYELKWLWQMRQEHFDVMINLTEGDRGAIAAVFSGAKERIGMATHEGRWSERFFTKTVRPTHSIRHTVERYLDAIRVLGVFPDQDERELFLTTAPVKELPKEYVHVHPVSRLMFKSLPATTVARLIDRLDERGVQTVLTASADPKELSLIGEIKQKARRAKPVDLSGQLTLKQLGGVIEKSAVLVSVDTVALHMASALKHPVVAIYGPSSEVRWAPWRNPHARVLAKKMSCRPCYNAGCGGSGRSDCLEQISELEILAEIDAAYGRVLGKRFDRTGNEKASL